MDIPEIDKEFIKKAFNALTKENTKGRKVKGSNKTLLEEFREFYKSEYSKLGYSELIDGTNLSKIFAYQATDMLTNIENNIKLNFLNYIRRYVNESFKQCNENIIENIKIKKDKIAMKKQLAKELYELKQDLIKNTKKCDKKYHEWLDIERKKILPVEFIDSYEFDIKNYPQKYLKYMIYMNIKLESLEKKMFQFFPLRTNIYPKYIAIDTAILIDIFMENKNTYFSDIDLCKDEVWSKIFNLQKKIFGKNKNKNIYKNKNKFSFDYRISTDGYSASIQLINDEFIDSQKIIKEKMKKGRQEAIKTNKTLLQETIENNKIKKAQEKDIKLVEKKLKDKQDFDKLTKQEKDKICSENKYIEFPYLDELDKEQLDKVKTTKKVYIDPGKRTLLYMMDDKGKTFQYTNKTRMNDTKRLKYQHLLKNYKDKKKICTKENTLSNKNSKTCNLDKFKEYITNKNKINNSLFEKYREPIFRKYKWYSYINKKRSEDKLLNKIEEIYGKDIIIIIGDWSIGKQMRNFISTPMISLKRKLNERFMVYSIDEYRTSCLHHKTETKCENIFLPDKKTKLRKIHSILTYQMENKRLGCINRDKNSCFNIIKIVNYMLSNSCERPLKYRRGYILEEPNIIKDCNPTLVCQMSVQAPRRKIKSKECIYDSFVEIT